MKTPPEAPSAERALALSRAALERPQAPFDRLPARWIVVDVDDQRLTLVGAEPGINRGAGCDSLERFIYIHGTNHEDALGRAASHGCVRMANADVIALFERVREGDPVLIAGGAERETMPDPLAGGRF